MSESMSVEELLARARADASRLADELVEHVASAAERPSADDIMGASCQVGRNHYPYLLASLYAEGLVDREVAAVVVPDAWSMVEFPNNALDEEEWESLFDEAGCTVDGVPAKRPNHHLHLWRGAIPECRNGWSWTDDRELAGWFAARPHNAGQGRVWTADVEPHRLLAKIGMNVRPKESEYVVDARGLTVYEDSPAQDPTSCELGAD